MMCSQLKPCIEPAIWCGRIESGGGAGGGEAGRGGGVAKAVSQMGICFQAPSPLQSQSQLQDAAAGPAPNARKAASQCNFMSVSKGPRDARSMEKVCAWEARARNERALAVCYGLSRFSPRFRDPASRCR